MRGAGDSNLHSGEAGVRGGEYSKGQSSFGVGVDRGLVVEGDRGVIVESGDRGRHTPWEVYRRGLGQNMGTGRRRIESVGRAGVKQEQRE